MTIGLDKVKKANIDNFTSDTGILIRRLINKPLRGTLKVFTKRKVIIESYAKLEKKVPYIFASTHSFNEDVIAGLANIDRSAYLLAGTTDQIDHNLQMYAAWACGMIYVDRLNPQSRKDSIPKMERILNAGSSIYMYPEGGWNNTENMPCQPLFAGAYILAKNTGAKVVPMSTYNEHNSKEIYLKVGEPLDLSIMEKKEALQTLREALATMMYESIEKHSTPIKRNELPDNARELFMEERRKEYLREKWTRNVWEEELAFFKDKSIVYPEDAWKFIDNVEVNKNNAGILGPILVKRYEDKKYNFKNYMHENWNK